MKNKLTWMTVIVLITGCWPAICSVWFSFIIPLPHWLVFAADALIIASAFISRFPKEQLGIFWAAVAVAVFRFGLSVYADVFDFSMSWPHYFFVLRYVETTIVLTVALLCFAIAIWHRLTYEAA